MGGSVCSSRIESAEVIAEVLDELRSDALFILDDFFAVKCLNKIGKNLRHFFLVLVVGGIKLFKSLLDKLFDKLMEKFSILVELLIYLPDF